MPFTRGRKPSATTTSRLPKLSTKSDENQDEGSHVKRSSSPPNGAPKKRTAFIDITNAGALSYSAHRGCGFGSHQRAHKVQISFPGRKKEAAKKVVKKPSVSSASVPTKNQANLLKSSSVSSEDSSVEVEKSVEIKQEVQEDVMVKVEVKQEVQEDVMVKVEVKQEVQEDVMVKVEELETAAVPPTVKEIPAHIKKQHIPPEFDIEPGNSEDYVAMCPDYAKDIFDYLKQREEKFVLPNYMSTQSSLNSEMRAILIDWLVEVQENFELFHETLYLAVKIADHFLSKASVHKEMLQLVGSTAMLIASKFEERSPPCVDDFLYICDDAYKREELIAMEGNILQTLNFDINIPIPYRFLRRYARCVSAGMDTLTLARFYCEMSLLDMGLVVERGSLLASACLLLALITKDLGGWTPCLQFHTGYELSDLCPVVRKLFFSLSAPPDDRLKAIRNKYSHKVFFEVAAVPMVDMDTLGKALS